MRITLPLDDALLTQAKKVAAEQHSTLAAIIENALRQTFAHQQRAKKRGKVRFTTSGKGGIRPGVDLDNSAALLDRMERPHDPR
jgi:hypothetical protein